MGNRKASGGRTGKFAFKSEAGETWHLEATGSDQWSLKRRDDHVEYTFNSPGSWERGERLEIAGCTVFVREPQGTKTIDLGGKHGPLLTGDGEATDVYDIVPEVAGAQSDVVAFAIFIARISSTLSLLLLFVIFMITVHATQSASRAIEHPGTNRQFEHLKRKISPHLAIDGTT